ncbi:hypothetical protein BKA56DRAFT_224420 [Ilyonectria sp. MPI-CAGE-AT-0026]|nr:hypothetical protein BKA56DRAFT_224420 [Ilyonectria sp. MPI-CAGE-AT-0026]
MCAQWSSLIWHDGLNKAPSAPGSHEPAACGFVFFFLHNFFSQVDSLTRGCELRLGHASVGGGVDSVALAALAVSCHTGDRRVVAVSSESRDETPCVDRSKHLPGRTMEPRGRREHPLDCGVEIASCRGGRHERAISRDDGHELGIGKQLNSLVGLANRIKGGPGPRRHGPCRIGTECQMHRHKTAELGNHEPWSGLSCSVVCCCPVHSESSPPNQMNQCVPG